MKTLRAFLCIAALLVAFATQGARADDSDSVGSGPVGPVESESAGPVGSPDSSETVLVAKPPPHETGKATQVDRWLIVALIAVLGLPQLSAMWERHRRRRRPFRWRWGWRLTFWAPSPSPPPSRVSRFLHFGMKCVIIRPCKISPNRAGVF